MAFTFTHERLADLLISPREDLNFEIKNWLNLQSDQNAKTTFAKAALALANHGGGFIALGLEEAETGAIEAQGRPAALDAYNQDQINGIIQAYADPPFHCAVHMVPNPAGALFPVVVIPGGHKVPIRARRSGPNGHTVEQHAIYIRKPGPRSEVPQSAQEWDELLARCLSNRRDELFDQIRGLISGAVPQAAAPPEPARIEQWIGACKERWNTVIATLPTGAGARCPHGYYWFAFEIEGSLREILPAQFPQTLQNSVVRHTGWPPFWYPTRAEIAPYPIDGLVECWLGKDGADPPHADFWRVDPQGLAFLLRGYQEDALGNNIVSGTLFDIELPVWRVGEAMLYSANLARHLVEGPVTINFVAHYSGLAGRKLANITGRRAMWDEQVAHQNEITLTTKIDAGLVESNLPEIIHPFLAPLYALFDFMDLRMSLVTEELTRLRTGRY